MARIIPKAYQPDKICVYVSIENTILLNELKKIFLARNIAVHTNLTERKNFDYAIVSKYSKNVDVFTNKKTKALLQNEKKRVSKKQLVQIKHNFNLLIHYSDEILKENKTLFSNKIVNELLTSKKGSFKEIFLNKNQKIGFLPNIFKLAKRIFYFLIIFTFLTNLLILIQLKANFYKHSYYPTKMSISIANAFSKTPVFGSIYKDAKKVLEIQLQIKKLQKNILLVQRNLNSVYDCIKQNCDKIKDFETPQDSEAKILDLAVQKYFLNDKIKMEKLLHSVLEEEEDYQLINKTVYQIIFSERAKTIAVAFQNPEIPTANGGVVEKIVVYSFNNRTVYLVGDLDINEISKISVNNNNFKKFQNKYFIINDAVSINFQLSHKAYYENLKNVIKSNYQLEIEGLFIVNGDFAKENDSKTLLDDVTGRFFEKDLEYMYEDSGGFITLSDLIKGLADIKTCKIYTFKVVENSFEGDVFSDTRSMDVSVKKVGQKYHYDITYKFDETSALSKKTNITAVFPKDVNVESILPKTWAAESDEKNIYYEIEGALLVNNVLKFGFSAINDLQVCKDKFYFKFETQPGIKYDINLTFNFDEDYAPLDNNSLTGRGLQSYNTTLFGQKSDLLFAFYKKD